MFKKIKSRINDALASRFYGFVNRFTHIYFGLVTAMALGGHLFLYGFPLLIFIGLTIIVVTAMGNFTLLSLIPITIATVIIAVAGLVSFRIATIKFQPPEGPTLDWANFPQLFEIINEVNAEYRLAKIHRVIIIEPYHLEIYKTPVNGFPYWSHNTLAIGLPLMQTLSPEYFAVALRRKLIQYSKRHHAISNWINQLRYIWPLYNTAFKKRNAIGDQLIVMFFSGFAPLYEFVTRRSAQMDELHADKNALDMVNAEELLKAIETMLISETFLRKKYWPNIQSILIKSPKSTPPPFNKIPELTRKTIAGMDKEKWLINQLNKDALQEHNGTKPPMKNRMTGLGCSSVETPEVMKESAAQIFLGKNYSQIVMFMNKRWLNRTMKSLSTNKPKNPVVPLKSKSQSQTSNINSSRAAAVAAAKK